MGRRVLAGPRARAGWKAARPRARGAAVRAKPAREPGRGGVPAHRGLRLIGIGIAIGGTRQRRLRAARAH